MERTLVTLKDNNNDDLFIIVTGDILKAHNIAHTYKTKGYSIKEVTPAKICIYKNEKCPILSKNINFHTIFYKEKEIAVLPREIEIL